MPKLELQPVYLLNQGRFDRRLAYRISDDDCWIWASTCFKRTQKDGTVKTVPYFWAMDPGTRINKQVYARRWAWENSFGPLPPGTAVVNVCGEPLCVKPHYKHNRPMDHGQWLPNNKPQTEEARPQARKAGVPSEEEFLKGGE